MKAINRKINLRKFRNISIYLFGAFLTRGIAYLATPLLTRLMSTEEYGILSLFTSWTTVFSIFIALQISGTVPSAYVKYKEDINHYISSVLILSLLSFAIIGTSGILFRDTYTRLLQFTDRILILLLILVAYGKSMTNLYVAYTIQLREAKRNVIFSMLVAALSLMLGCIFSVLLGSHRYYGKILADVAVYLSVIIFVFYKFKIWTGKADLGFWKEEIVLGIPLILHLLSTNIISQSDRMFIAGMISYDATAIYSVAYTIGMLALVVVEAVFKVWTPWFFSALDKKKNREINEIFRLTIILLSFLHGMVMVFSPELFRLMAPVKYGADAGCTMIITISTLFNFYYRFPLCYEQYQGQMKWVAIATGIASALNLVLNYFMILRWGIYGAAVATVISTLVLWLIHEFVVRTRWRSYPIRGSYYSAGISIAAVCLMIARVFQEALLIRILISAILLTGICGYVFKKYGKILEMEDY